MEKLGNVVRGRQAQQLGVKGNVKELFTSSLFAVTTAAVKS